MVTGFSAIVPVSGYGGWAFIEKTQDKQKANLEKSPVIAREVKYFKDNIAKADTPEKLMKDYRLYSFVMTAYRLDDSMYQKGIVTKAFSQPSTGEDSLVTKLSDKRWQEVAIAMGYGDKEGGNVADTEFQTKLVQKYLQTQWETSVGEANPDMETALYSQQRINALSQQDEVDKNNKGWYTVISESSLRDVFQTVFGFPSNFVNLNVDQQAAAYQKAAKKMFGDSGLAQFNDADKSKQLIRRFFAMKSIQSVTASTGNPALSLLTGSSLSQSLFSVLAGG